jgi:hypothetical protein
MESFVLNWLGLGGVGKDIKEKQKNCKNELRL